MAAPLSMLLVAICIVVYNQGEKDRRESQIKVANNLIRIRTFLLTMLDMDPGGIDEGRQNRDLSSHKRTRLLQPA